MKLRRFWTYEKGVEISSKRPGRRISEVSAGIDLSGFCRPRLHVAWYDRDELGVAFSWELRGCDPGLHLYLTVRRPPRWLARIADRRWFDG